MRKQIIAKQKADEVSLYKIAKDAQLAYTTVWKYFNCVGNYNSYTEMKIAKALGVWE